MPVVAAFDGYRGIAVLGIVLFHLLAASGLLFRAGETLPAQLLWGTLAWSISVFFIVSGFVMFLPTAARNGEFGSVRAFAVRRAARLFPALWAVLLISLALLALLPNAPLPMPGLGEVALNLSGQAAWATLVDAGQPAGFGVDPPVWTLTLEIGFYIVLPLVAATYFRRPLVGLAVAAGIAILWREAIGNLVDLADFVGLGVSPERAVELQFGANQLPHWAFSFGAGMTAAWAYVRLREAYEPAALARAAKPVAAAGLLAVAACAVVAGRYAIDNPPAAVIHAQWQSSWLVIAYTAALATVMLAISLGPPRLQLPFGNRRIRLLADISYGVYLIHAVLLWVIEVELSPPWGGTLPTFAIMLLTVVPLSLAYGYASTRFLEQPIRRRAREVGRPGRRRSVAAAPAAAALSEGAVSNRTPGAAFPGQKGEGAKWR